MEYDPIAANRPLVREIEAFCERHGLSASRFGREAVNDTALVTDLRAGRQLTQKTLFRVRQFMNRQDAGVARAAP